MILRYGEIDEHPVYLITIKISPAPAVDGV